MKKIILLGSLASLFFSSTFVINKWLTVEQNSPWFWTASLRYFFVIILLIILISIWFGFKKLKETLSCFYSNFVFWIITGGIGFGCFYLLLCYASNYSDGWVLASTWQTTILFSPLVFFLLGEKVNLKGVLFLVIMFMGVILINYDAIVQNSIDILHSILPILVAAICYPIGNTLCKYACEGKYKKLTVQNFSISKNPFSQVLMMALGALPLLITAGFVINPTPPSEIQIKSVLFISITTGVVATSLLYYARILANQDSNALAFADGTQTLEVPLALLWEITFFNGQLPKIYGAIGLIFLCVGMLLFYKSNIFNTK